MRRRILWHITPCGQVRRCHADHPDTYEGRYTVALDSDMEGSVVGLRWQNYVCGMSFKEARECADELLSTGVIRRKVRWENQ